MNRRRSRAAIWWERHQWRVGRRPRRFGAPPQLFDKVKTLSAITTQSGRAMPRGSEGTVIDTDPTGATRPSGYVVEFSLRAPKGSPGGQWEMAIVHPAQIVRRA